MRPIDWWLFGWLCGVFSMTIFLVIVENWPK